MLSSLQPLCVTLIVLSISPASVHLKHVPEDAKLVHVFNSGASFDDIFTKDHKIELDPVKVGAADLIRKEVQLLVKDLEYTGLNKAIIDEFSVDFHTNLAKISFHADVAGRCSYKLKGSLFSIPVDGEGHFDGIYNNFNVEMVMPFEIVEDKNGQKCLNLKTYYSWHDIKGDGELHYSDIYNGDKHRNATVHTLMNHNFRIFSLRIGEPFFDRLVDCLFDKFQNYMSSLPISKFSSYEKQEETTQQNE